jgi:lycopene beta-cyclase
MTHGETKLIIAGGGLSGCLAALALARQRPEVPLLLIEAGNRFGGNHTWSFFDADLDGDARGLVDPLIGARWQGYDIRFPRRSRTLSTAYNSVTSERLDAAMRQALRPDQYRLQSPIEAVAPDHVTLAGGETISARGVLDARGPGSFAGLDLGWQKFVGSEFRLERPHGLLRPIVMDATVDQADGYRFVYSLPFSDTHLLVEDTYYSLSPRLDAETLGRRIDAYVADHGWTPAEMVRREQGVLPVALGGSVAALWNALPGVPKLGLRGGFFHPTTGYSLPDAARTALLIARHRELSSPALYHLLRDEAARLWRERRFYRRLNRMLFHAAAPTERYKVLEHFYRLDPALVARFYAGRLRTTDKLRILSGKPPVPVGSALAALRRHRSHSK